MELSWEKWLIMASLAAVSIFLGMIPLLVFYRKRASPAINSCPVTKSVAYNVSLSIIASFGGGVLLATAMAHMLPEARENLRQIPVVEEYVDRDFPLAEILTLIGFGATYIVEEVAHFMMVNKRQHAVVRHNSSIHSNSLYSSPFRKASCPTEDVKNFKVTTESSFEDVQDGSERGIATIARSLLALVALSFHAVMEGIAIGIQESASLWFMFGAVASHKFVISFCMGMQLFAANAQLSTYLASIIFFGAISPVGIFIGTCISAGQSNALPIAVIKGLSTGTLLYVVFFEILIRERSKKDCGSFQHLSKAMGCIQFLSIAVGMAIMTVLVTVMGHEHSLDHEQFEGEH